MEGRACRGDPKDREEVTHHGFAIHDFRMEALGAHSEAAGRRADEAGQDVVVVAEVQVALPDMCAPLLWPYACMHYTRIGLCPI